MSGTPDGRLRLVGIHLAGIGAACVLLASGAAPAGGLAAGPDGFSSATHVGTSVARDESSARAGGTCSEGKDALLFDRATIRKGYGVTRSTQRAGYGVLGAVASQAAGDADRDGFNEVDGVFAPPGTVTATHRTAGDDGHRVASDCARQIPVIDPPNAGPPFPVTMVRHEDRLYAGSWQDQITVIDISAPGNEHVVETIDPPVNPVDVTVANGDLYVIDEFHDLYYRPLGGGEWQFIELASDGGANHFGHGTTLFPHDGRLYVLDWENGGQIQVTDLESHTVVDTVTDVSFLPDQIEFLDDVMIVLSIGLTAPSCLADGPHFSVFDLTTLERVATHDLPNADCAAGSALVSDRYYITFNNTVREYDPVTGNELNRVAGGGITDNLLEHVAVDQQSETLYLTATNGDVLRAPADLSGLELLCNVLVGPQLTHPPLQSVALDANASRFFVANLNEDSVSVVDLDGEPPEPSEASQDVIATVPDEPGEGSLVISVDPQDRTVTLPEMVSAGDRLATSGVLRPVTVIDTRTADPGWDSSAQVSDFTSGSGSFGGGFLGWTPSVASHSEGQDVTPGAPVAPGFPTGDGLAVPRTMATAEAGAGVGTAVLGAGLRLEIPVDTAAGTYTAVLTLTAI